MLDALGRPRVLAPAEGLRVSALCWDAASDRLLVGTTSNALLRLQLHPHDIAATLLTQGHGGGRVATQLSDTFSAFADASAASTSGANSANATRGKTVADPNGGWSQLRALAEHPRESTLASVGDDGVVRVWRLRPHALQASRQLPTPARAVAYSPDGAHLALGCVDGSLLVLSTELQRSSPSLRLMAVRHAPPASAGTGGVSADAGGGSNAGGGGGGCGVAGGGGDGVVIGGHVGDGAASDGLSHVVTNRSVCALAYSPDGRLLAAGDECRRIRLYSVVGGGSEERSYQLAAVCVGHLGAVMHLGWSADSGCLRSNCDGRELRFWDERGAELNAADTRLAALEWHASSTALFGADTAGLHSESESKGATRVCAVGRSHGSAEPLIAVGDEFQRLRVVKYPVVAAADASAATASAAVGHAGAINAARFSFDDRYVITSGGEDLCIFVWRLKPKPDSDGQAAIDVNDITAAGGSGSGGGLSGSGGGVDGGGDGDGTGVTHGVSLDEEGEDDEDDDSDVETLDLSDSWIKSKAPRRRTDGGGGGVGDGYGDGDGNDDDDDAFDAEDPSEGEQLGSIQPWRGAVYPPTHLPDIDASPPPDSLRLRWVHGFRGFDTRRAALWTGAAATVAYAAAAVVVAHDAHAHTQRHFQRHTDDVLGVAVHRRRGLVASSQKSFREGGRMRRPTIWVWEAESCKPLLSGPLVFIGCNQRWVSLLSFDASGDLLCSVGADDDHTLVVWDWAKGTALCHMATHKERVFACRCSPFERENDAHAAGAHLVLAGKGLARLYQTGSMPSRGAKLSVPARERAVAQLTVCFPTAALAVLGGATGSLHAFRISDAKLSKSRTGAHSGPIHVLAEGPEIAGGARLVVSGGKDGCVRLWNEALEPVMKHEELPWLSLSQPLPQLQSGARLRALDWCDDNGLLIGTHASELLQLPPRSAQPMVLVQGHAQQPPREQGRASSAAGAAKDEGGLSSVEGELDASAEESGAVRALVAVADTGLFASGGDDASLRFWDADGMRPVSNVRTAAAISCLSCEEGDVDREGLRLAVGYCDGTFEVLRLTQLSAKNVSVATEHARTMRHAQRRRVTVARFAPSGDWLAIGSADAVIYLHDARNKFPETARCRGHSSAIATLDWTTDSFVIRSNCSSHELRFWDVPSGEQISLASTCRDLPWASSGVTLAWHSQGIFLKGADGSGIHSADQSDDGALLATTDEFSLVNLHRYPCVQPEQAQRPNRRSFAGHASPALACRWVSAETLVTAGGFDLCLLQWSRERDAY